ncbi:hypothetical protein SEA_BREYLOR17_67 [Arthrobacter phage Breylor17]|uniref:Uncharacterized protein n=1 Tax=Arthrobacter phage Breylor17 TaxID=2250409 RepID=A0A345KLB0_9CAUD|nr:hypothetical protein QCN34_gp67 [Arthrobacter phage Breylor17]AXH43812.1 hypothetical protein SEA_BREYLOR17_67 [Arthrobacter phage Breylor17]
METDFRINHMPGVKDSFGVIRESVAVYRSGFRMSIFLGKVIGIVSRSMTKRTMTFWFGIVWWNHVKSNMYKIDQHMSSKQFTVYR